MRRAERFRQVDKLPENARRRGPDVRAHREWVAAIGDACGEIASGQPLNPVTVTIVEMWGRVFRERARALKGMRP